MPTDQVSTVGLAYLSNSARIDASALGEFFASFNPSVTAVLTSLTITAFAGDVWAAVNMIDQLQSITRPSLPLSFDFSFPEHLNTERCWLKQNNVVGGVPTVEQLERSCCSTTNRILHGQPHRIARMLMEPTPSDCHGQTTCLSGTTASSHEQNFASTRI